MNDGYIVEINNLDIWIFIEAHNNEGNETKIEIDADEVEEGILKQLFYKVEHKKIPQSRYRKLQPIHSINVLLGVIAFSVILIMFGGIFVPDICKNIWDKIDAFAMKYSWLSGKTVGVAISLGIVGIGITSYLAKIIMSRFHVKELKLPADTTLQSSEDAEESVFNKNLDEIMYFFEETQYQLIFFEDLDRLENRKIFVHLRELNNLLNNDDAKFIQILSAKWNSMWEYISRQNTMTYGRQVYYLKLIIEYVDEKELSLLNVENCITSYFEKHEDILQQLNDVGSNKIIAAISNCDVCFEKLNIANVSDDIVEYIFDNCCFKLNDCMVRNVISYKKKNLLNMFENQPYSTIIKLEYKPLIEYVHENMKEYIEAVVLKKTIIEDENEDIIDLLRRILEESDLCASVICLENFEIEKLADCLEQEIQNKRDKVKVVWNTLLEQNKIGIS